MVGSQRRSSLLQGMGVRPSTSDPEQEGSHAVGSVADSVMRALTPCKKNRPREHLLGLTSLQKSHPGELLFGLTSMQKSPPSELLIGPAPLQKNLVRERSADRNFLGPWSGPTGDLPSWKERVMQSYVLELVWWEYVVKLIFVAFFFLF